VKVIVYWATALTERVDITTEAAVRVPLAQLPVIVRVSIPYVVPPVE
jgi:hypothetical protein